MTADQTSVSSAGMSGFQKSILGFGLLIVVPLIVYSLHESVQLNGIYQAYTDCLDVCEKKYFPDLNKKDGVSIVKEKALYKHADCRVHCDRAVRKADTRHLKLAFLIGMFVVNLVIIGVIYIGLNKKFREDKAIEKVLQRRKEKLVNPTEYEGPPTDAG